MRPSQIFNILDIAKRARENKKVFNPLFVGAPGVGKSQIVQAWCKQNKLPFIDLRAAYLEAPDLIGFPSIEKTSSGTAITVHNIPEFWPQDPSWKGVVLLEEPNRGTTSVMNTFMQILTDRKVHKYVLPEGALIVGCINPEGSEFDVNTMDAALKDRFAIFNVAYDKKDFISYMKKSDWSKDIIMFVESNTWQYTPVENIASTPGAKYVSPRTFSALEAVLSAGLESKDEELLCYNTILGTNVGRDFYNFRHNESPVLYSDLVNSPRDAFKRLKEFSNPSNLKNGMLTITIEDIKENKTIEDKLLVDVLKVLPVDLGAGLVRDLEYVRKDKDLLTRIYKAYPEVKEMFRSVVVYKNSK